MTQEVSLHRSNLSPEQIIQDIGSNAKQASALLAQINSTIIDHVLKTLSKNIIVQTQKIIDANDIDVLKAQNKNLSPALIDRLKLDKERIAAIAQSVLEIAALDNPVGIILETIHRPNGLAIEKTSVPIGVLGMIYESRPNVTIDAAALCLKSRNAVILRGGSESFNSSTMFHSIITNTLKECELPSNAICMMPNTDRALVGAMLKAHEFIDVIIPRGGKGLTERVIREATMPVFAHLDGNCHIFVHHTADIENALKIIENAKLRRTGVCGAVESLLIDCRLDKSDAQKIINLLIEKDCIVYGDEITQTLHNDIQPASMDDWSKEYLDKKISVKFISDTNAAISHINKFGSHHTDAILSEDDNATHKFLYQVDSAIVIHNASTQFADGGEFGMGAEIGIGTGKLHARGPVGVKQLTTFKYIVRGSGQIRA